MSREAKYRCWHKQAKEYRVIESVDFDKDGKAECIVTLDYNTWHDPWNDLVEDVELEQYTGLKDKNGKEIYEGDIANLGKYGIYVVVFNEFWCGFEFEGGKGVKTKSGVEHPRFSQDWQTAEVIGNIHENPELLGGEDE